MIDKRLEEDIICLQEKKVGEECKPRFRGYQQFTFPGTSRCRGLITFIKSSIPVTEIQADFRAGTENQTFKLIINNQELHVVNLYVGNDSLNVTKYDELLDTTPTLLVGDLNAKHTQLGSNRNKSNNINDVNFIRFVNNSENIRIINNNETTHLMGNRLMCECLTISILKFLVILLTH